MKSQKKELIGKVIRINSGTICTVEIEKNGKKHNIISHISGKMRKNRIKITQGDTVTVIMTQYDKDKARIDKRH